MKCELFNNMKNKYMAWSMRLMNLLPPKFLKLFAALSKVTSNKNTKYFKLAKPVPQIDDVCATGRPVKVTATSF